METNINNNIESELSKININLREHIKDLALEWAVDKSKTLLLELNDEQQTRIWENRDGNKNVYFYDIIHQFLFLSEVQRKKNLISIFLKTNVV